MMPTSGTFHYTGVVPESTAARESGEWRLTDGSGAPPSARSGDLDRLGDDRLVGLQPTLRVSGRRLVLEASGRPRSVIRSAALELDPSLVESLRGGDVITLLRTHTADLAVSIMRRGRLMVATGAVTMIPLGDEVVVQGGPAFDQGTPFHDQWPRSDTWLDVCFSGETRRLRRGEQTTMGPYRVSVVRCYQDNIPGTHESVAITLDDEGFAHDATLRSAELLARSGNALIMEEWG
ncbi:MAG TPA: hypothetical protein VJY35_07340 [Candidatus Eisenbacteria bacterium]|nr:hypothetical protein [Candidatus Eisenbacteria bacterium]